jgi:hypothetical protein
VAEPAGPRRPVMVNVDGLRLVTQGTVRFAVSGRVRLVEGTQASHGASASVDATTSRGR